MSDEDLEDFTDAMVEKVGFLTVCFEPGLTEEERMRQIVQMVIVDTDLLANGIPLERWVHG